VSAGSALYFWIGLLVVAAIFLYVISRGGRRRRTRPDDYASALNQIIHDDWDGALASLQRAIQSGHTSPDAYIKLGTLLRRRGDHTAALQIHQGLTVRQDLSSEERNAVLRCLVDDLRALGRRAEALRTLQQLAQADRNGDLQKQIAEEALASGEFETAEKAMREAQRIDGTLDAKELATFIASIGESCFERDQHADAKRYLQAALKEDDGCEAALLRMGDLAYQEGDHESALYYWQKLAFAAPASDPELFERLEKVYFDLGKFGEVERVYAQILEKRPRDREALLAAARIAAKKGELDEAERLLRHVLEQMPESRRAFRMLAHLLLEQGKTQETRELLDAHLGAPKEDLATP
jgi:lipopolysaccharide biosynthesis regulator YciM